MWAIWNDLYHEDVSDDFRDLAYAVMALCPQHTFLVLTKRAGRMEEYWSEYAPRTPWRIQEAAKAMIDAQFVGYHFPFPNVWHGVTAEKQEQADARIPHLLRVPGKRFLSVEPMLGPVDLNQNYNNGISFKGMVHAVLLGGESGKNARFMNPDWVCFVRDQCAAAGVPFFFKQWGEWVHWSQQDSRFKAHKAKPQWWSKIEHPVYRHRVLRCGKRLAGRTLDGRLHDDLPWGD